jgi:hypothetical protein
LIAATGSWRTSSADVIEQAVWLSVRFPLSLRMIEDLLAALGIVVNDEAVRCRAETIGRTCAWADLRQQDPSARPAVRRQVTSQRGRDLDQRQEALVVARRRCGRFVAAWFPAHWFKSARAGAQRRSSQWRSSCASSSASHPARRA